MQSVEIGLNTQAPVPSQGTLDAAHDEIDVDRIVWDLEYREEVRRRLSHS